MTIETLLLSYHFLRQKEELLAIANERHQEAIEEVAMGYSNTISGTGKYRDFARDELDRAFTLYATDFAEFVKGQ